MQLAAKGDSPEQHHLARQHDPRTRGWLAFGVVCAVHVWTVYGNALAGWFIGWLVGWSVGGWVKGWDL